MGNLFLIAATFVGLVSGAAINSTAIHQPFTHAIIVNNPPCPYYFTPFTYKACYDDSDDRVLTHRPSGFGSSKMTVELCQAACKANHFKYAGLEYYRECYCGASLNAIVKPARECSYPCDGNSNQACGGHGRISIYVDETFKKPSLGPSSGYFVKGCYSEATRGRALSLRQNQLDSSTMTISICLAACKSQGYPLAGVEFYGECYCDLTLGEGSVPAASMNCETPCKGNNTEMCGGSKGYLNFFVNGRLREAQPCDPTQVKAYPVFGEVGASLSISV